MRSVVLLLSVLLQVSTAQQFHWDLPLSSDDGTYVYTFQGQVSWGKRDAVVTDSIEWKMHIHGLQERRDVRSWIVRGYPLDLAFYEPGKKPSQRTIVESAGNTRYFLGDISVVGRMADGLDNLQGLVRETDIILQTPVRTGTAFGETTMLTRSDGMYVWRVESVRDTVTGTGNDRDTVAVYTVVYRALTSVQQVDWMPGVGLIRYYYHHNGSPSDVDVRLVSVSKP